MTHKTLTRKYDESIAKIIGRIPPRLHRTFHLIGYASMPIVWIGVFGAFTVRAYIRTEPIAALLLILALLPAGSIMKFFFRRQRPPTIYAEAMRIKSYSFPSGHAYSAALGGGYIAYRLLANQMYAGAAAMCMLIVIIGISRTHIGAHYPSDVTAGWILGAIALGVVLTAA